MSYDINSLLVPVRVFINADLTLLIIGKTAKLLSHNMDDSRHFGMNSLPIFLFEDVIVEAVTMHGPEILAKNVQMRSAPILDGTKL